MVTRLRGSLADVSAPVPEGRKLLRLEVRNAETPIERKPSWIKTRAKMGPEYTALQSLVKSEGLHTVCQEAGCPNIFECWEDREATFLIGGDQCTRRCDFCQIDTGKPQPLDRDEPRRVAESVRTMELRYATITGVARDDLDDGGAWLYAETVRAIHELNPDTGVENLIPDFNGSPRPPPAGLRVAAGGAGPQRRDGAADLQADPAGVPLRAVARRAHPGPHVRAGDQVQPDPRHGRDPRGGQPGDARPARRRLRAAHHHPVPPPLGAPPPRRAVGQARGVRRASAGGDRARVRRGALRTAGAFVVPCRSAVPSGDGRAHSRTDPPRPSRTRPRSQTKR